MRVFVPATFDDLRALHRDRVVPAGRAAVTVTPAFREAYASGDEEELEYAALALAAASSLELVTRSRVEARRVVLACDTDDVELAEARTGSLVLTAAVPIAQVAAVHVDDVDVDLADAEGYELMWFATQELDALL